MAANLVNFRYNSKLLHMRIIWTIFALAFTKITSIIWKRKI